MTTRASDPLSRAALGGGNDRHHEIDLRPARDALRPVRGEHPNADDDEPGPRQWADPSPNGIHGSPPLQEFRIVASYSNNARGFNGRCLVTRANYLNSSHRLRLAQRQCFAQSATLLVARLPWLSRPFRGSQNPSSPC